MQAEQLCSVWVPLPHLYRGVEAVAFGETSELLASFARGIQIFGLKQYRADHWSDRSVAGA